ncbi:hypothetical protein PFICI_02976 [Pestalotiopsis fici W106-1]|uniref:Uncharacterized protein n=1 Tax=Pestalotiopsis fici (strain W106-1 / CGMCC3.15140) TaxID=1229662 RepID=W3XI75_PESFW|nr:uncharacterized protein PFICI_02976 [Pestalotiopsis fici W106-1]ETS84951.1 hypothetical protein PFICI_02976 [Pestalotiopsis fici W106-1]
MFNIARHPELFDPLREEIQRVLASSSFTKQSLQELKLMDSVIKESQRLKPIVLAPFRRLCTTDIKLTNGWTIRKGEKIIVSSAHMQDSAYYDDPLEFDGYRFMRMRQTPGEENYSHLVSTSEKHIGFGHGQHACPGRFFAANEVKIALCHLLLKYDWKLPDGHDPKVIAAGMALISEPNGRLAVRRRVEEIDLDSLSEE